MNPLLFSRREFLSRTGAGFGAVALNALLAERSAAAPGSNPLAVRPGHFPARAKRCVFLYMPGGPSHVDLFDPKPRLSSEHGKPLPFAKPGLEHTKTGGLFGSPWQFSQYGQSGLPFSELLPNIAQCADDLCVVRSMVADNINHTGANYQMCFGDQAFPRPSIGSWVTYGLGSENANLPGFVVIAPKSPPGGGTLWSSSFLPAAYQGTWVSDFSKPVANLSDPLADPALQRDKLEMLRLLNGRHASAHPDEPMLEARIASFELAFRMQMEAPEAFDLERETKATRALYGVDDPVTAGFGKQCLLARRLLERGVRFVHVFDTSKAGNPWDNHNELRKTLPDACAGVDKPVAGFLKDLKARGLLDDTLVIWGGEFGRTPTAQLSGSSNGHEGREHHPFGFTMWMAGGGVKAGHAHGETDEYGWYAVRDKVHVHDLHATILHLMGLDHKRLTYRSSGRDYRLTDVSGNVVSEILA
jgi:hypothetical protein